MIRHQRYNTSPCAAITQTKHSGNITHAAREIVDALHLRICHEHLGA